MPKNIVFIIVAAIIAALIPIVPYMLRVRIWVLRKIQLVWFADLHDNHFEGFVLAVRIILATLVIFLLFHGIWGIP